MLNDLVANTAAWNGSSWGYLGSLPGEPPPKDIPRNIVYSLTVYNGRLIAGGNFPSASCNTCVAGIAAWNGSSWSPLGSWNNLKVYALTVYDSLLIAGGAFSYEFNHIAGWDKTTWVSLGAGLEWTVFTIINRDGLLIAGGSGSGPLVNPGNRIAAWNGSSWSYIAPGLDGWVMSLIMYNGRLIAGGTFRRAEAGAGLQVKFIAAWND